MNPFSSSSSAKMKKKATYYHDHNFISRFLQEIFSQDLHKNKVTEGDDVNVEETSHSKNSSLSSLTMRKSMQNSTLSIRRPPRFKAIYRQPENYMVIKWRGTVTPQIIFPYDYDHNLDEDEVRTALAIIEFPENPRIIINNPLDAGFVIGETRLTSVTRGLTFLVGRTFHRVGNPIIRSLSGISQHPPILDRELVDVKYFMGYDDIRNCYKIIRFLDVGGENEGTLIDAFTIGVDAQWREVGFTDLMIVFDPRIPNEGIQTLESSAHHLFSQSTHVHFFCQNGYGVEFVLSFDFFNEQHRELLLPQHIERVPTLCCLQNTLCCSYLIDNTLQIHQSTQNNGWMLLIQVNILFNIPHGVFTMHLPICLHGNLLLLAFHGAFNLPGHLLFGFNPHGIVINVVTGTVELVNGFPLIDWFLAKNFSESSEVLPY